MNSLERPPCEGKMPPREAERAATPELTEQLAEPTAPQPLRPQIDQSEYHSYSQEQEGLS
ncbi:hypothetical protein N7494_005198 [Penicillium frequentans]|uniref:Uncharacterized protein n=1 Tax=Penicillium frequentans TaxID=3151616 RepID=A0AAD6GGT5_9EURO|nr:hypothetical protein N7494_005198 [Penicillium glabrum]